MADHDDVEVENFEITDMDLMHGFGLGFRRRKMTKEEAIYGMWAEKDSDDDDIPSGFSGRRKKDYSKPLNFVSGGIVQKGKDKNKEDDGELSNNLTCTDTITTNNDDDDYDGESFRRFKCALSNHNK
mgnify:CR=1 FL=1